MSLSRRKLSVNVPCQVAAKMLIFGRPSVKRFALCYRAVVQSVRTYVLSCLSVTLVYCGQTVGHIKMTLGMQVGLGPGHTVLDRDPAPPHGKWHSSPPHSSLVHVYCGQVAECIKMKLVMDVGLGLRQIVLNGDPAPLPKGAQPQIFNHVCCAKRLDGLRCHLVGR